MIVYSLRNQKTGLLLTRDPDDSTTDPIIYININHIIAFYNAGFFRDVNYEVVEYKATEMKTIPLKEII